MHVSPLRGDSAELFGNNKVWVASPALPLLSSAEDLGASYAKINTKSHSQSNFSVPQVPRHHRDSSHDLFMWRGVHFCFSFYFALLCFCGGTVLFFSSFRAFQCFFFQFISSDWKRNQQWSWESGNTLYVYTTNTGLWIQAIKKKKRMQGNCSTNTDALIPHQQHVSKCGIQLNNCFLRNCICMVICSIPIWCHIIPCGFPLTQNIKSRTRHELGQTPVHREACLLEKASVRYGQGC